MEVEFYVDYGYLYGKIFNNFYDDGSFFNVGAGFRFFVSNYQVISLSMAASERQLNKNEGIRQDIRGSFAVIKLGYTVY